MIKNIVILICALVTCIPQQGNAQKHQLAVYIFLSPECPLSQNYTKTLNALNTQYQNRIDFIGIIPGKTYSSKEVKRYLSEYRVNFRVTRDVSKKMVDRLKATVTPEVILVNANDAVLYRGAIDDWAISLGKKKLSPTIPYLKNAIEQVLNGEEVILRSTKPVGCLINDY